MGGVGGVGVGVHVVSFCYSFDILPSASPPACRLSGKGEGTGGEGLRGLGGIWGGGSLFVCTIFRCVCPILHRWSFDCVDCIFVISTPVILNGGYIYNFGNIFT